MDLRSYQTNGYFDELVAANGAPRVSASRLLNRLAELPPGEVSRRQSQAEAAMLRSGATFNVYGKESATERIIPFDVVPRIIDATTWSQVALGLKQRVQALNLFLGDVYDRADIIEDGIIPREYVLLDHPSFAKCKGLKPPRGIWCHIGGIDLVRDRTGQFFVLEDNLRCPSGVSYVLENRRILKQTFPQLFGTQSIRPVDDYPERLLSTLEYLAPNTCQRPNVVVLTPGIYNSAYFEHAFLARQMGVPLVEGRDLLVQDGVVTMKTTSGLRQVDVIYRRVDDEFLDPVHFETNSVLGVPGIIDVYRDGRVAIVNAPGTGIADNKVIYAFVPEMIRYYLNESPILPNVRTFLCGKDDHRKFVLDRMEHLVVKPAHESGGKGILIGPHATKAQRERMAAEILRSPRDYVAQPTVCLSRAPTVVNNSLQGRHVDLRPYVLFGEEVYVLPGGLTRVALQQNSLVVNSSQGGGTKDTWIIDDVPDAPE